MRVHVIGNLCRDTTLTVARFPVPGETLVARDCVVGLGGKGLNQAVAAARAGAAVLLHAAVNRDEAPRLSADLGRERGLEARFTGLPLPTDNSILLVRDDGENAIVSATACAQAFNPVARDAAGDVLAPGDILLMQGNLSASATRVSLRKGRLAGALTVFNPSPLWHDERPDWRDIDLLVANAHEVAVLSGEADPGVAAAALLQEGAGAVAVTLGARGLLYRTPEASLAIEAPPVEVHDNSGARDVFCGVLVGLMACGVARPEAMACATAAASLSVTRRGALASCPTAAEIAALSSPSPSSS